MEPIDPQKLAVCLEVLAALAEGQADLPDPEPLERLVAAIYKQRRKQRRKQPVDPETRRQRREQADAQRARNREQERQARTATTMAGIHQGLPRPPHPDGPTPLAKARSCYTCAARISEIHPFYHMLCDTCARLNLARRGARRDLRGRRALITGGRIKIGFQTELKLLRDGAHVMVTSRFPVDAARRYAACEDFDQWSGRLHIRHLDLLDIPNVLAFCRQCSGDWPHLDILINNAAQSVRREPSFHHRERQLEAQPTALLPGNVRALLAGHDPRPEPHQPVVDLPAPDSDRHGQPIDRRERHSWTYLLDEVPPGELLECLLINSASPALLTGHLRALLTRSPYPDRYVVNVGGLDGRFESTRKGPRHPHVNMSKAALNMLTRTSAADYAGDGIYMTSVDTGWISHEGSYSARRRLDEVGLAPPLDEVDGAARIYDPIVRGQHGEFLFGCLLRNYQPSPW